MAIEGRRSAIFVAVDWTVLSGASWWPTVQRRVFGESCFAKTKQKNVHPPSSSLCNVSATASMIDLLFTSYHDVC